MAHEYLAISLLRASMFSSKLFIPIPSDSGKENL